MAEPLTMAVMVVGVAVDLFNGGPMPATRLTAPEPQIEQLYRDNGKIVGRSYLNVAQADQSCPAGYEVRRQGTREDGSRVYLTWTLRCR